MFIKVQVLFVNSCVFYETYCTILTSFRFHPLPPAHHQREAPSRTPYTTASTVNNFAPGWWSGQARNSENKMVTIIKTGLVEATQALTRYVEKFYLTFLDQESFQGGTNVRKWEWGNKPEKSRKNHPR